MIKTRQWKWTLIALCAVLVLVLATLGLSAIFQGHTSAFADDLILPDNTSEYTFSNDATVPWEYNETTNEFFVDQYSVWSSGSQDTTLTLTVSQPGKVAFKWKFKGQSSNENKLQVVYKPVSGAQQTLVVRQGDTSVGYLEWHEIMQSVSVGDQLIFTASGPQKSSLGFYNGDYTEHPAGVVLQGFKVTQPDNYVQPQTVEVYSDDGGNVTVPELSELDGKITITPEFGKMYTATASAQEGYVFKYWTDDQNNILSYDEEFVVPYWHAQNIKAQFIAKDSKPEVSYQKNINDVASWSDVGDGAYKCSSIDMLSEWDDGQKLFIDFYGDSYFTLHYVANFGAKYQMLIKLDGGNWGSSYGNENDLEYYFYPYHVLDEKLHTAIVYIYAGYQAAPGGDNMLTISDISVTPPSQMELHDFEIDFDPNLARVNFNGRVMEGPEKIKVAENERINLTATKNRIDAVSSLVEGTVQADFVEWQYKDKSQCVKDNGTTIYYAEGSWHYADGKTKEEGYIYASYKEHLPYPEVTLIKTSGGHSEPETGVENGQDIQLAFGEDNSLVFAIKQIQNMNFEYKVTKTDSTGSVDVPVVIDSKMGFNLSGVQQNTTIQIMSHDPDGKYADSLSYTLTISMFDSRGVQAIVNSAFEIPVENDETLPWYLDPANNGEDTYAYKAGNSNTSSTSDMISQIKFDVSNYTSEKSGQLKFEFKFDGPHILNYKGENEYYAQVAYNTDKPLSILGSDYPGWYNENSKETIDGTVFAKGGSDSDGWKSPTLIGAETVDEGAHWYSMSVPVDVNVQSVYIGLINSYTYKYETSELIIRNVMFVQGEANISWGIKNGQDEEQNDGTLGTISVTKKGSESVSAGSISKGTALTFTVSPQEGKKFYAWVNKDGKVLSYDLTFKFTVGADNAVYAIVDKAGTFAVRVGDKFYSATDIEKALSAASQADTKDVIIVDNATFSSSFTIPEKVNFVIPFNNYGAYYAMGTKETASSTISWTGGTYKNAVYKVTFDSDVTVNGKLVVGAVIHYPDQSAQGHTSGAYSQLILNGNVSVKNGGVMDVYGLVTGTGGIDVESGGVLYQPFLILDYAGGQNTQDLFNAGQTPFKRYAMINIQCEGGYTIHYGAELWGHASLYFLSSITTLDTQFISYTGSANGKQGTTTLINLTTEQSWAKGIYNKDKTSPASTANAEGIGQTTLTIHGGANAGYMDFLGFVQTDDVTFSIPYNYNIVLEEGTFELGYDYKLMPGASLTVTENAILNLNAKFLVYDGLVQSTMSGKGYPTADALKGAKYNTNATFIVNGKFNINDGATFLGVVQSEVEGATIKIATDVTLSGTIIDGGTTDYDCNYMEYESSARVWDTAHGGVLATLTAGRTYTSATCASWELPQTTLMYDSGTSENDYHSNTKVNHKPHDDGDSNYIEGKTEAVTGMQGSWAMEHDEDHPHVYDWTTKQEGDVLPDGETLRTTITHQCTEIGCTEHASKELLYVPSSLGDLTYNGKDVTDGDLQGLVDAMFQEGIEATFSDYSAKGAKDNYTVTVTLSNALWLDGESSYVTSKQLTFNVKPATLTLKPNDQSSDYNGKEVTLDQSEYSATGLCGGDELTLSIKVKDNLVIKDAGEYTLIIEIDREAYPNYDIELETGIYTVNKLAVKVVLKSVTRDYNGAIPQASEIGIEFKQGFASVDSLTAKDLVTVTIEQAAAKAATYTVSGTQKEGVTNYAVTVEGATYTINKKKVTVTADTQSSVYGKSLNELTYNVNGLVGDENIDEYIDISTEATEDSGTGSYAITVKYKSDARPDNYEVEFVNSTYTITDAAFEGVTFANDTVDYDGEIHELKVQGAPDGAQVTYTLEDGTVFNGAKDQGVYKITATVTLANYQELQLPATLTINKRDITVSVDGLSRAYNGKAPQTSELTAKLVDSTLGKGDDLSKLVAISLTNASENVGDYSITAAATAAASNYNITFGTMGSYRITPAEVTISIQPQTKVYDGKEGALAQDKWTITSGEWAEGKVPVITLELADSSMYVNVGNYNIKGSCADTNYNVTFENGQGAYTITKRTLTVTAENKQSVYGDTPVQLTYGMDGRVEDGTTVEVTIFCDVTRLSPVTADGYVITVSVTNADTLRNYDVKTVNGVYTIAKRTLTITIGDQQGVYNVEGTYSFDSDLWSITSGSLASGESRSVLKVTLAKPQIDHAGSYEIKASYDNGNYDVEIVNGSYEVSKLDISDDEDTFFELNVDGDTFDPSKTYTYSGTPLALSATVYYLAAPEAEIAVKVDPQEITLTGYITVTVTIEDTNYTGSKTYTVTVAGADGVTGRLQEVLDELATLCGDLTADTLTATDENFTKLKQAQSLIDGLTEDEKTSGAERLAPYTELIQSWDKAQIAEDVISTAKAIADAPLKGLMLATSLNALIAIAYVALKGGIL